MDRDHVWQIESVFCIAQILKHSFNNTNDCMSSCGCNTGWAPTV